MEMVSRVESWRWLASGSSGRRSLPVRLRMMSLDAYQLCPDQRAGSSSANVCVWHFSRHGEGHESRVRDADGKGTKNRTRNKKKCRNVVDLIPLSNSPTAEPGTRNGGHHNLDATQRGNVRLTAGQAGAYANVRGLGTARCPPARPAPPRDLRAQGDLAIAD